MLLAAERGYAVIALTCIPCCAAAQPLVSRTCFAGDFVADVSMARDGFPSMALAACFASPLFTSIAGLGMAFTLTVVLHGDLSFTAALPLKAALGFAFVSVLRYVVLVPLLHKWQLGRAAAVSMLLFYMLFQVAYLWAIARTS